MSFFRRGSAVLCAGVLAACTSLVTPPVAFSIYDLGPPDTLAPAQRVAPAQIEVRAPSWLASSAMQYRLDYQVPAGRQSYAESRWAGQPAEMLQRLLAGQLGGTRANSNGCRLRIELDEFAHVFDSPESSRAHILARAAILPPREEAPLVRELFSIRVDAPSPNAVGGVEAHREAARTLVRDLGQWLEEANLEPAVVGECRP